jgi:ribokinase
MVSIDHLPRRDEKQWATLIGDFSGGMAANVAVAYARLGGSVALLARVGRDRFGELSLNALRQTAVDVSHVMEIDSPTFWTFSLIDGNGEKAMVEFASEALHPPWDAASDIVDAKAVYTIGSEATAALESFTTHHSRGITTVVDADFAEIESEMAIRALLRVTGVLFCNGETAKRLTESRSPRESARLLSASGPRTVVITLGKRGALGFDRDEGFARVKGLEVKSVDTTGAGDCFAGSFLYARARSWPLNASLEIANVMAAMSTTAFGCQAGIPSRDELMASPLGRDLSFRRLLS